MANLDQSNIYSVFRDCVFFVPDYQRGYSWEERQWGDLIKDLELLPPGKDHFFGTLVLRSSQKTFKDEEDNLVPAFEIIDGQQRLTTVAIFMNAIYQEMISLKSFNKTPDGLRKNYLYFPLKSGEDKPKLVLNRDCQEYFENQVLGLHMGVNVGGPSIRAHRRLRQARVYFEDRLRELRTKAQADYPEHLDQLYRKVAEGLKLIVYIVDDEMDAAGLIFEAMNDRGRQLTQMDLVKNYILYLSSRLEFDGDYPLRETINKTWTEVFERLAQIDDRNETHEESLLRYHWVMAYSGSMSSVDSRTIKEKFDQRSYLNADRQLFEDLSTYLNTFRQAAIAYRDICRPDHSDSFKDFRVELRPKIVQASQKLVRLGVLAAFFPLLLAVRYKSLNSGEDYLQMVEACERFAFRVYRWQGRQSRTGQSTIYWLAHRFFIGERSFPRLLQEINSLALDYCSEARFIERFTRQTEDWYAWAGIKYFLYEYELYKAGQAGVLVRMPWEQVERARKEDTIEHILPRNPEPGYWTERFSPEAHQRWVGDIGNLTLTYENNSLGNKPFPQKKGQPGQPRCYASSSVLIEREIAGFVDWTPAEIEQRRVQIKTWAVERWRVPGSIQEVSSATIPVDYRAQILQKLRVKAERAGVGDEFMRLVEAAQKYPMYMKLHPYWQGTDFTPIQNKNKCCLWIGPSLWLYIGYEEFERFFGISADEVKSILGAEQRPTLKKSEVDDFIERLDKLFKRIEELNSR